MLWSYLAHPTAQRMSIDARMLPEPNPRPHFRPVRCVWCVGGRTRYIVPKALQTPPHRVQESYQWEIHRIVISMLISLRKYRLRFRTLWYCLSKLTSNGGAIGHPVRFHSKWHREEMKSSQIVRKMQREICWVENRGEIEDESVCYVCQWVGNTVWHNTTICAIMVDTCRLYSNWKEILKCRVQLQRKG